MVRATHECVGGAHQVDHEFEPQVFIDLLREADALVMAALNRHGMYDEIWQCPTVLVPLNPSFGAAHCPFEFRTICRSKPLVWDAATAPLSS